MLYNVQWFKSILFLYSYDARSGVASHWKNTRTFGSRATYHPDRSTLVIKAVTPNDASTYTCRIEFRTTPTLSYTVNLTVVGMYHFYLLRYLPLLFCPTLSTSPS